MHRPHKLTAADRLAIARHNHQHALAALEAGVAGAQAKVEREAAELREAEQRANSINHERN